MAFQVYDTLRGGKMSGGPGFFYPPTVLMGPPHGCKLMKEEQSA